MASSSLIRLCRAMTAATRSSSSTGGAAFFSSKAATGTFPKAKTKAKAKPKEAGLSAKPKPTLGIMKPIPTSTALGSFLGVMESCAEAVKQFWVRFKIHNQKDLDSLGYTQPLLRSWVVVFSNIRPHLNQPTVSRRRIRGHYYHRSFCCCQHTGDRLLSVRFTVERTRLMHPGDRLLTVSVSSTTPLTLPMTVLCLNSAAPRKF
ncbi:hypothetical protein ACFX2I_027905 [Malus domestica]